MATDLIHRFLGIEGDDWLPLDVEVIARRDDMQWSTDDGPANLRQLSFIRLLVRKGWTVTLSPKARA